MSDETLIELYFQHLIIELQKKSYQCQFSNMRNVNCYGKRTSLCWINTGSYGQYYIRYFKNIIHIFDILKISSPIISVELADPECTNKVLQALYTLCETNG